MSIEAGPLRPSSTQGRATDAFSGTPPIGAVELSERRHFPAERDAVPAARHAVSELVATVDDDFGETAELLVSELVTNSVKHSGMSPNGLILVHVLLDSNRLRIEVADDGPGFDVPANEPNNGKPGGRGLLLVRRLSQRWGMRDQPRTCVWFELARAVP